MANQVLEEHFRKSILKLDNHFIDKIQVNPFGFTDTPADFFIQNEKDDILVECKQISMKNRKTKPSFQISRLTQEKKLYDHEKRFPRNKSFILISFWYRSKKSSSTFLIPIEAWIRFRKRYFKSNIDPDRFLNEFEVYLLKLDKNEWIIQFE